jgi:hypothetical protein
MFRVEHRKKVDKDSMERPTLRFFLGVAVEKKGFYDANDGSQANFALLRPCTILLYIGAAHLLP